MKLVAPRCRYAVGVDGGAKGRATLGRVQPEERLVHCGDAVEDVLAGERWLRLAHGTPESPRDDQRNLRREFIAPTRRARARGRELYRAHALRNDDVHLLPDEWLRLSLGVQQSPLFHSLRERGSPGRLHIRGRSLHLQHAQLLLQSWDALLLQHQHWRRRVLR